MKNHASHRFTSAALALAMLLSVGVTVSAKPVSSKTVAATSATAKTTASTKVVPAATAATSQDGYTIVSTGTSFQIHRAGKTLAEYDVKNTKATLTVSKSGNVVLTMTSSNGMAMNVNLNAQNQLNFSGDFASLTITNTVPADRSVLIAGSVQSLNVNGTVPVTVSSSATVGTLKVGATSASVTVKSGAKITSASAAKASAITGYSGKISAMSAVAPSTSTVKTPISSSSGLKTGSTTTSNAGKEQVYLDVNEADSTSNTDDVVISNNNKVELVAKDGVSLGLAMKDVTLEVTHDTDKDSDRVSGQWKWVDASSTTYTSGTYIYRFYPSLSSKYPTVDVTVNYTGSGSSSSKTLGKPGISFVGSSHGKGGDVRVEVVLPDGIRDDSTMWLSVDRKEIEYDLDEDDSKDERTLTASIDPSDYEDGDKVKIFVKIKSGGRSATSKTINYTVDK